MTRRCRAAPPGPAVAGALAFDCNICGKRNTCDPATIGREDASCEGCGSSVRLRAMVHLLTLELFGESLPLERIPLRTDLFGFGLSDWSVYAGALASRLSYINTYYHTVPRLDITAVPAELEGTADFLIATDVFEHVLSPVSRAFEGARKLLRRGGVFIFSVPFEDHDGETIEHFRDLEDFALEVGSDGRHRLRNRRRDGTEQVYEDLVFHGGPGSTLEMRRFTRESLLAEFRAAGFSEVRFAEAPEPRWGIFWTHGRTSVPMVARA